MTEKLGRLVIRKGSTFRRVIRWGSTPKVFKAITGATKAAPCVLTVPSHGLPPRWPVAVTNVKGMTEVNAPHFPPWDTDYVMATKLTSDTIQLDEVNAGGFRTYTSGGFIEYDTPVDLTGYTARMSIKDRVGGTELLSLTTENDRLVLDTVEFTIEMVIDNETAAEIDWTQGVYDLELISPSGEVFNLTEKPTPVIVIDEVTT